MGQWWARVAQPVSHLCTFFSTRTLDGAVAFFFLWHLSLNLAAGGFICQRITVPGLWCNLLATVCPSRFVDFPVGFSSSQPETDGSGLSLTSHLVAQASRPVFLFQLLLGLPAAAQDSEGDGLWSPPVQLFNFQEFSWMQIVGLKHLNVFDAFRWPVLTVKNLWRKAKQPTSVKVPHTYSAPQPACLPSRTNPPPRRAAPCVKSGSPQVLWSAGLPNQNLRFKVNLCWCVCLFSGTSQTWKAPLSRRSTPASPSRSSAAPAAWARTKTSRTPPNRASKPNVPSAGSWQRSVRPGGRLL